LQEKKQQQLAALDMQYQGRIMAEVERYQALLQEKELLNHKWDEQNATLVEAHEKVVQEITEELEAKLMEEQTHFQQLQQQKDEMSREFEEVKQQLEEDADRCVAHAKLGHDQTRTALGHI
jgi:cilia- and flagella-associated protein 57